MKTFQVTIGMTIRCENQEEADQAAEKLVELLAECVPASRLSICARILVTIRRIVR